MRSPTIRPTAVSIHRVAPRISRASTSTTWLSPERPAGRATDNVAGAVSAAPEKDTDSARSNSNPGGTANPSSEGPIASRTIGTSRDTAPAGRDSASPSAPLAVPPPGPMLLNTVVTGRGARSSSEIVPRSSDAASNVSDGVAANEAASTRGRPGT
jgi:hypothetical protein